ncbi:cytochrome c oxidase assembly protein CtaG/Cox11-domain-containing protein [Dipodascopsis uninucleata]
MCRYFSNGVSTRSDEDKSRKVAELISQKLHGNYHERVKLLEAKMKELNITMADVEREEVRQRSYRNQTVAYYTLSLLIGTFALSYAAVPFYRMLCQRSGWGGTPMTDSTKFTPEMMTPVGSNRKLVVTFESDVSRTLPWSFVPQQKSVTITPGETALAFFTAENHSKDDIIGVATYGVNPAQVAPYFNKIQCFCFEQQQLRAGEQVDMPVFFFIDPEFDSDPLMKNIHHITLNYTFFSTSYNFLILFHFSCTILTL